MILIEIRSTLDYPEREIRQFAEHRVSFALNRFQNLRRVVLSIGDVNGPKGGPDKRCRMIAEYGLASVVIEEVQVNWQSAVALATRRLARKLARELERTKRSGARRMVARGAADRVSLRKARVDPKISSD